MGFGHRTSMQLTSLHTEADGRDLSAVYYLPKNDADAASFQVTISTNTSLISLSLSPRIASRALLPPINLFAPAQCSYRAYCLHDALIPKANYPRESVLRFEI